MTLAFALRGSNGLVLGADSRMSNLEGSADTSIKFLQVNREIGVLTYGLTEVGYKSITRLVNEVNQLSDYDTIIKKRIVHLSDIAKNAENIYLKEFENFIAKKNESSTTRPIPRDHPKLLTGFIMGALDINETNQFKILSWSSPFFQCENREDNVVAARWPIAQYLINHFYYREMTVEQLKILAVFLLVQTAAISEGVGGAFHIASVTFESGFQQLLQDEIQRLMNDNQVRFAQFRKMLLDQLG